MGEKHLTLVPCFVEPLALHSWKTCVILATHILIVATIIFWEALASSLSAVLLLLGDCPKSSDPYGEVCASCFFFFFSCFMCVSVPRRDGEIVACARGRPSSNWLRVFCEFVFFCFCVCLGRYFYVLACFALVCFCTLFCVVFFLYFLLCGVVPISELQAAERFSGG